MTEEQNSEEAFLASLEDFVPTIPDELVTYYLKRTGFDCPDLKVRRLVALAAQKFISEVANDALQYSKLRQAGSKAARGQSKEKKLVLTMEDLAFSLKNYGLNVKKPPYFADSLTNSSSKEKPPAADKPGPSS
mmetsp:Transcript_30875/g.49951  ORF Transcript_30875/g.49951 Transcript_30875/m.49951 type:complete len:133 (-) Transcript_30875:141-539(-)